MIPNDPLLARWQQLSALYDEAVDRPAPQAAAWLADLQARQHPLAAELARMLDARQRAVAGEFLASPPRLHPPRPAGPETRAGSRIGPWQLRSRLGAGGMAEVWLAERADGALSRQVAVKLLHLHAGRGDRWALTERFARERDIVARLRHPNIAALHDAGVTDAGQPWLALELVEGQPLDGWCDARQLTVRARVQLFQQVLQAVQHAHGHLVMHRDLKPANILVTPQGQVRLLDFGIAKFADRDGGTRDDTELTRDQGRPMTPRYASPEQLLGQPLSVSCDVYALGIVLYELLTGVHPYASAASTALQIEQAILESAPGLPSRSKPDTARAALRGARPRALQQQLSGDLDAVLLRALNRLPARRYASAEAFQADLQRWLDGEPVQARTPGTGYRLQRFVGRHPWGVGLGSAALAGLVGLAATATVFGLQARQDSARAAAARDFMINIFRQADPERTRGAAITAGELLASGRRDALGQLAGQPQLQSEMLAAIAKSQVALGQPGVALQTLDELRRIQEAGGQRAAVLDTTLQAAEVAGGADDFDRQAQELQRARALADPRDQALAARLLLLASDADFGRQDWNAARTRCAQSYTAAAGHDEARFDALRCLARAAGALGQNTESGLYYAQASALAARLAAVTPRVRASLAFERSDALMGQGAIQAAGAVAAQAHAPCAAALGPQAAECRRLLRVRVLAQLRREAFDVDDAVLDGLRSLSAQQDLPFDAGTATAQLARFEAARHHAQALPALVARLQQVVGAGPEAHVSDNLRTQAALALIDVALFQGQPRQAEQQARDLLAAATPVRGEAAGRLRTQLGVALMQQGRARDAAAAFDEAAARLREALPPEHPRVLLYGLNRAAAGLVSGHAEAARSYVDAALPTLSQALGSDAPVLTRIRGLSEIAHGRVAPPADVRQLPFFL